VATIKKVNPDLLPERASGGEPITEEPPEGFFDGKKYFVPGIGEPALASFLKNTSNPIGW
jgi:hypothetical protein